MNTYLYFWRSVAKYPGRLALFLLLLVILGLVRASEPYFLKLFIEWLPQQDMLLMAKLLVGYLAVRIGGIGLDIFTFWVGDHILFLGARDVRQAVFRKVQDLDFAFHQNRSTGSLISIFKRGDAAYFNLWIVAHSQVYILMQILVMLFFFSSLNLALGIALITTMLATGFAAGWAISQNIKHRVAFNQEEDRVSSVIVDNLMNYETVKYFGKEVKEEKRLAQTFIAWMQKLWGYANSFRMIDLIVGVTSAIGFGVIIAAVIYQNSRGIINLADAVVTLGFITTFYPRLFEMVYKMRDVVKNHTDLTDYFGILDNQETVLDPKEPVTLDKGGGEIAFENVYFGYTEGKKEALVDFNLKIKKGESIALVGKSGVGKTTLIKLLLRFFDVDQGRITIDKIDIRALRKAELRRKIGVVPQEPVLFNNTIAYNIAYGKDETSRAEVLKACRMAHLTELIETMPNGLETQVGERGVKLSGGQKQRLAIARMILADPEVIIFDEATSQLDSESERFIQEALWKVAKNKTTIIVAHRLSTVVRADRIIVMENGKIAEMGTHKELLMIKNGIYKHYWDLQVEEI